MDYFREEEYAQKDFDLKIMRRMLKYVLPFRWQVAVSVFLLLIVSGLELLGPILTKHAIDVDIAGKDMDGLWKTVMLYFVILVCILAAHFVQMYMTSWVGQKAVLNLRMEVFEHLQKLSPAYYDRNPVGRLITRVTSDVQSLDETISAGLVSIFGDIFIIIGIVSAMLWLNWRLALVSFLVVPLVFYLSMIFRKFAREAFREVRLRLAKINTFLNENISGMAVTHLFNLRSRNSDNFDTLNKSYYDAHIKTLLYFAIFFPAIELVSSISTALILGYGGGLILGGMMTLGGLLAFLQYTERFFRPIRDLSEKYNIMQSAMASSERLFALLDSVPEIQPPEAPIAFENVSGKIEFKNVSFSYNDGIPVLKDISFTVEPGETMAVVGHTGAGKTSVARLIERFYEFQEGTILIDGYDIRSLELNSYRQQLGIVYQTPFLFSGTVCDNIRFARPETTEAEIIQIANQIGDGEWLDMFSNRLQTETGERGAHLSMGQRQLVSLMRVLVQQPAIFILDEATASIDPFTEWQIQQALDMILSQTTSILIAHRLSTVKAADRIITLERGRIIEEGSHDQLIRHNGHYASLYNTYFRHQSLEYIEKARPNSDTA